MSCWGWRIALRARDARVCPEERPPVQAGALPVPAPFVYFGPLPFWVGPLSPLVRILFVNSIWVLFIIIILRRALALGIHPGAPVPRLSTLDSAPALRDAGGIVPILSFVYWVEFAVLRKI